MVTAFPRGWRGKFKDALKAGNPVDATVDKLIPATPSEDEYRRQAEANAACDFFDAEDPLACSRVAVGGPCARAQRRQRLRLATATPPGARTCAWCC
jgi:hypothetical protein